MKQSVRLSNSVHLLALIALDPFSDLTSTRLAKSINTNPSYVRQLMSKLKKAGLLNSTHGHARPSLNLPATKITLLDIYQAVEPRPLLNLDTNIDPNCGTGQNIQIALGEYYDQIQNSLNAKLSQITLQDVLNSYSRHLS